MAAISGRASRSRLRLSARRAKACELRRRSMKPVTKLSNSRAQRMPGSARASWMKAAGRGDDLAQQIGIGAVEVEQRRQLLADLLAQRRQRLLVGQHLLERAQKLVEQALVPALLGDGAQQARRQRRQLDPLQLGHDPLADEALQAGLVDGAQGLRQQPQHEVRQRRAALAVGQPVGHEGGEIDVAQPRLDRLGRQEIGLDEFAQRVGDAQVVARDDGGVRDRQAERPAEQGDDGVPVGEPAHGRGRGEGRDVAPGPVPRLEMPRHDEQRRREDQQRRRRELDAAQIAGALRRSRLSCSPTRPARSDCRPRASPRRPRRTSPPARA